MRYLIYQLVLTCCLSLSTIKTNASPITFNYTLGGFSNGGTVTGTFTGQDTNNDGYLSSFIFSQDIDFSGTPFAAGLSEITHATATFNGAFDAGEFGGPSTQTNLFTLSHDLTDVSDTVFGAPMDLFFLLNVDLNGGNQLGDNPYEGMLLAPFDQEFVFGFGPFLPSPGGTTFFENIPAGNMTFSINNLLAGGATLTSGILDNQSGGTPCLSGSACGVVHSVFLDDAFVPNLGGFDVSNQYIQLSKVSEPLGIPLVCAAIASLLVMRLRSGAAI